MKSSILKITAVVVVATAVFVGCGNFRNLLDSKIQKFNGDSNTYKAELDQVDDDINNALSDIDGFGKTDYHDQIFSSPLCGVTIDCTQISDGILFFNFDGVTPCFSPSRTRSGQIKVELIAGSSWDQAGAILRETLIDFKITRLSDNASIEFDGVKTHKNINGHDWWQFLLGNADFAYESRANDVQVTFDNSQTAVWNHARTIVWSYRPSGSDPNIPYAYVGFEASGDTTIDGTSGIDSWGTNRFGSDFITYYTLPIKSNTYCGLWRFNQGGLVHEVDGDDYTLTLGVDQQGNATSNTCAYGFKVSWNVGNNSNSAVFSY